MLMASDNTPDLSALEALSEAQRLAFAPVAFFAADALKSLGILAALEKTPQTLQGITQSTGVSAYGVGVLLDMGISIKAVLRDGEYYHLGRLGHFLLNDTMTRVNLNFVRDVCYAALPHLAEAIRHGAPAGLPAIAGPQWDTIYPALSSLRPNIQQSWFEFDHFYSDQAFPAALEHLKNYHPKTILDFGGNTGRWALCCAEALASTRITLVDLPQQLQLARAALSSSSQHTSRIDCHPYDFLSNADQPPPPKSDMIWMSQFLDCFAPEQIVGILQLAKRSLRPGGKVAILEPLCDRQDFPAAEYSLNATSLYFTVVANGNSRFYRFDALSQLIERAGLEIVAVHDGLGYGHSLLICNAG
jgi:ubiquinone/menaquinone biosynthesis C-methylase UbiE